MGSSHTFLLTTKSTWLCVGNSTIENFSCQRLCSYGFKIKQKCYSTIDYLCNFDEEEAMLKGMDQSNRLVANVGLLMFEWVIESLSMGERGWWQTRHRWTAMVWEWWCCCVILNTVMLSHYNTIDSIRKTSWCWAYCCWDGGLAQVWKFLSSKRYFI